MRNKIPLENVSKDAIMDAMPGTVGYIVPWAMQVGEDLYAFIDTKHKLCPEPDGSFSMKVKVMSGAVGVYLPLEHRFQTTNRITAFMPVLFLEEGE